MGMDLLTIGWTSESSKYDAEAVKAIVAAITAEWLEANADKLDDSGYFSDNEELRFALENGADDYQDHLAAQHRYGTLYEIGDSDRHFYIAGGGSWGDDPYEGWMDLATFITACGVLPELAAAAGFIGGGIKS